MSKLIPRLDTGTAAELIRSIESKLREGNPPESVVQFWHSAAYPNPLGGEAANETDMRRWRNLVAAQMVGLPTGTPESNARHGMVLGRAIAEAINPLPSDAAHDGVWSFLSLVVFPDIVWARWPAGREHGSELPRDRWIGRPMGRDRNYLKQSWRRWTLLGERLEGNGAPLLEDELVNLLERSALARNARLVQLAAEQVAAWPPAEQGGRMMHVRRLMRELRRQTGGYLLDVLEDEEMRQIVKRSATSALQPPPERAEL